MAIDLHLSEGIGTLYPTQSIARNYDAPLMHGTVCFDVPADWNISALRVPAEATLARRA